ncbi:unnamed protein product [Echinostoma caproni]|uniref:Kynureninase n=1 Tax=Echinostoma caproni TaxID=27848 RepID=A0A183ALS0_9TREM|nr:unnamed protein product [Echinostoma caproni]
MSLIDFEHLALEHDFAQPESTAFARWLDSEDSLGFIRDQFRQPDAHYIEQTTTIRFERTDSDGVCPSITYLCGHSLGLQPTSLLTRLTAGLDQWACLGVLAYANGQLPASSSDLPVAEQVAREIVGAKPVEVALTNNLSINMHLLLTTFYRPIGDKNCILIEKKAFPTDYYVIESQIAWHGLDPASCIIQLEPRAGEWCLRTDDILCVIRENASRLALIWLPGVQYITGQLFDIPTITRAGHELAQCPVGWDLAHAVGNVELQLHAWEVDLAVWCSYKYLNASPGAVGGLFVHEKHHHLTGTHGPSPVVLEPVQNGPRLTGWWSHRAETRFDMTNEMELAPGAAAYRVSNPPFMAMIALQTSLDIVHRCGGMKPIRERSIRLTGYLDYLLRSSQAYALPPDQCLIVTPNEAEARGAQITIAFQHDVNRYFHALTRRGFICDVRKPNCIRVSPNPLYTRFVDVLNFAQCLHRIVTAPEPDHE